MTLADLLRKAKEIGDQFNTYVVPLYDEAYVQITNVEFEAEKDEDGKWFIQMIVK